MVKASVEPIVDCYLIVFLCEIQDGVQNMTKNDTFYIYARLKLLFVI